MPSVEGAFKNINLSSLTNSVSKGVVGGSLSQINSSATGGNLNPRSQVLNAVSSTPPSHFSSSKTYLPQTGSIASRVCENPEKSEEEGGIQHGISLSSKLFRAANHTTALTGQVISPFASWLQPVTGIFSRVLGSVVSAFHRDKPLQEVAIYLTASIGSGVLAKSAATAAYTATLGSAALATAPAWVVPALVAGTFVVVAIGGYLLIDWLIKKGEEEISQRSAGYRNLSKKANAPVITARENMVAAVTGEKIQDSKISSNDPDCSSRFLVRLSNFPSFGAVPANPLIRIIENAELTFYSREEHPNLTASGVPLVTLEEYRHDRGKILTLAVDPKKIPYGSRILITGYDPKKGLPLFLEGRASDTGEALQNLPKNQIVIDIPVEKTNTAKNLGRIKNVTIDIFPP